MEKVGHILARFANFVTIETNHTTLHHEDTAANNNVLTTELQIRKK